MTENITVFIQNSIKIESDAGNIYIDPFRMEISPRDADFIMITHDHYDHFSLDDIKKVAGSNTVLIVPSGMKKKADDASDMVNRIETVEPGKSYSIDGLNFETVPSYNKLKPFHPKGAGWVGYIINSDGKRIYIAGDTDATNEAKEVSCDIALVPVGGTYTMNSKEAAALINIIKPEVAIPVHYGEIVGKPADGEVFAKNVSSDIKVEFKIRF